MGKCDYGQSLWPEKGTRALRHLKRSLRSSVFSPLLRIGEVCVPGKITVIVKQNAESFFFLRLPRSSRLFPLGFSFSLQGKCKTNNFERKVSAAYTHPFSSGAIALFFDCWKQSSLSALISKKRACTLKPENCGLT